MRALLLLLAALPVGFLTAAATTGGDSGAPSSAETTTAAEPQPQPPSAPAVSAPAPSPPPVTEPIRWRQSSPIGLPYAGRLVNGVRLPAEGKHFFTWDPVLKRSPNRAWRRWGTDGLIRIVLRVVHAYAKEHTDAPRVAIGDLSRKRGGNFGRRFGSPGHASHQNGLDVDVYYPRRDGRERAPRVAAQVDRRLAQDLVERFVAAGASKVFVGPNVGLTGPRHIVQVLARHDNHLHVRIPPWRA